MILSPAKLNLMLHVTGKRNDGYHTLQTVFQLIDLCDHMDFRIRDDGCIVRTKAIPNVPETHDLTIQAARLLQEQGVTRIGHTPGVEITVEKRIPMGAGLGGGSSNAATTLLALNHLWNLNFTKEELMKFGLRLGADVPFFLFGCNAMALGVGEELHPLTLSPATYVVIYPHITVSTAAVFQSKQLTIATETVTIADFPTYWESNQGIGTNDLQPVTERLYPPVKTARLWLEQFAPAVMTGSGSCVFARVSEDQADAILKCVPSSFTGYKVSGLNTHPFFGV